MIKSLVFRKIKALKKRKTELMICIGGCMPQEEGISKLLKEKYPFVDIVLAHIISMI